MLHAPVSDTKQQSDLARTNAPAQDVSRSKAPPLSPQRQRAAQLQRAFGNQATLRMLKLARPAVQTKLTINKPGDAYEQEADRVADQVMRMTDADIALSRPPAQISRKCAACAEEDKKKLQMKSDSGADLAGAEAPPIVHEVLREPGQPLDAATRSFFEPRFGYDFGGVRVHMGTRADHSARLVSAVAYTVGQNVIFREGRYAPSTKAGAQLLAHELTHVVQQRAGDSAARDTHAPNSFSTMITRGHADSLQMVGECAGRSKSACWGSCVPASGKGTGFCRWSGTIKYGCICITADQPMLSEALQAALLALLIAAGVVITLEALAALIACFASGACELAALIAALGFAGAMIVIGFLKNNSSGSSGDATASADNTDITTGSDVEDTSSA